MTTSVLLQYSCLGVLAISVLLNRCQCLDPKLPLLILALAALCWFLLGVYIWVKVAIALAQGSVDFSLIKVVHLILACMPIIALGVLVNQLNSVPRIHDITTDTSNPPVFTLASQARHRSHNPTDYDPSNIPLQQQSYPTVQPLLVRIAPDKAMQRVKQQIKQEGWEVHGIGHDTIEAYATTQVLGFVDDIVIRITPWPVDSSVASRIDMRSASRIGQSDFGANAKRIQLFFEQLQHELLVD